MLAKSESQSGTRTHEPLRNSNLRQVTTTDEDPEPHTTYNAGLLHPGQHAAGRFGDWTPFQKIAILGIRDGSSTGTAMLEPTVFGEDVAARGTLITIGPPPDADAPANNNHQNGNSSIKRASNSVPGLSHDSRIHLFAVEPMFPEPGGRTLDAQVRSFNHFPRVV